MAFNRNLNRLFTSTHCAQRPNLLVSGCSYTWNNSLEHICAWPYYLRDIANYLEVIDCSQSAAGTEHIFNSVVYTIETQPELTPENTDIIIMWSGLERTDLLAGADLVNKWYHMDHMTFSFEQFSSLSVCPDASWSRSTEVNQFLKSYRVLIDNRAQILSSCLKILTLASYLRNKGFNHVFTTYMPMKFTLALLQDPIVDRVLDLLADLEDLDSYTTKTGQREPDGHPTPDTHLSWTREILVPFLTGQFIDIK